MKTFSNVNPPGVRHAMTLVRPARGSGQPAIAAGGGRDALGMMKDRLVPPDVLVNLKAIPGLDEVKPQGGGVTIGGLMTLAALAAHPVIRRQYPVLAEAA